jgi:hypothetical protein
MNYRSIALLTLLCMALATGGCESFFDSFKSRPERKSKRRYEEVLLPGQTGSRLQRRMFVERGPDRKKSAAKKEKAAPKLQATPERETAATPSPTPEEESTPTSDRFR